MNHTPAGLAQPTTRVGLASWGAIRVTGDDARDFLHGQLSNDLLNLPADSAQWTAYCSPKGRMLSGFLAWRDADGAVLLCCDRALAAGLSKRLRMFVLRARAQVEDASDRFAFTGVIGAADGPAPMAVRRDGAVTLVGLAPSGGAARHLIVAAGADEPAMAGDENAWRLAQIRAGEAWITPATSDQFVPQMANFDALGGISFKKGCYPGQEVVARAHYRGAVKRRMYRASVPAPAEAGQPLFSGGANAQECGMVASAAAAGAGASELLAVVSMQSRAESAIHLGAPDGPGLEFAELPYAIPEAA